MSRIVAKTKDHRFVITEQPPISAGNQNVDELAVRFDDSWMFADRELYAHFEMGDYAAAVRLASQADGTYTCKVPREAESREGMLYLGVYCVANDAVVKTSTISYVQICNGTPTGADVWIDWESFRNDLIAALNERFAIELAADADNDAILEAIASLQNGAEVRAWWIDFISRALQTPLSPDDSDVDISLHVSMAIDRMLEGSRHYHTLAGLVNGLIIEHVPEYTYSGMIEPEYLEQIPVLDSHMTSLEDDRQTLITALSNLYIGG